MLNYHLSRRRTYIGIMFIFNTVTLVTDAELEEFVVHIIEANNRGVSAVKNVSSEPNWSFGQSLFFAGTILTTIGKYHQPKKGQFDLTPTTPGDMKTILFIQVYLSSSVY